MERDAEFIGDLARLDEQALRPLAGDAEFVLERHAAVLRRHRNADEQLEVLRAFGFLDDLLQLFLGVEGEAFDVVVEVGAADGVARFDRVHEVQPDARNGRGVFELGDGRNVELRDARAVERAEQKDGAVGLVGVGDFAREILDEPARRACRPRADGQRRRAPRASSPSPSQARLRISPSRKNLLKKDHPCWCAAAERWPLSIH